MLVKQAGEVSLDPATGQLTTTVKGLPPLPYSSLELHLREGPTAPLITPQTCATYTTTARLYPFSDPTTATELSTPFTISSGAAGAPCAHSEAELPNAPTLSAGSTLTNAGSYSPFLFKLSREDGTQRFGAVIAEPPLGLTAKLAGVPACSEAGIAQAASRSAEGDGAAELADPSCPAQSQVGSVIASAGAGPSPYFTTGRLYLAGPYKGAPLSFVAIVPAIAGPFDLGVVTSRIAAYVDEETAKITAKSDPLPTILHGIPLDLRSVSVQIDRSDFTLNPTSCEATTLGGSLTSLTGSLAPLSQRFQVGGCRHLGFKPALKLQLKGQTKRGGNPALTAILRPRSGDANIASLAVALPHSEFLDQAHIRTICTRVQFAAGAGAGQQCPAGSVYGQVSATSPLLDYTLSGPVFLRSSSHKLPDLVAVVRGPASQPLVIASVGRVDSIKGGIRNSFEALPDAPLSKVVLRLPGGQKSLLENSTDICQGTHRATAKLKGQNGKRYEFEPVLKASGCKGKKSKRHGGKR